MFFKKIYKSYTWQESSIGYGGKRLQLNSKETNFLIKMRQKRDREYK